VKKHGYNNNNNNNNNPIITYKLSVCIMRYLHKVNHSKTKRRRLYLKTQSVPRC